MNKRLFAGKRITAAILACMMVFGCTQNTFAETSNDIKKQRQSVENEKKATEAKLDSVQSDIEGLSEEKEALEEEVEELDGILVDLLIEVSLLQSDIDDKKEAIAAGEKRYDEAVITINSQKDAMAKRIKYMYEKGNESYMEILLESRNMADAVNKVSFTEKLYAYDRQMLEQYQITKREVEWAKNQLETDLSELEEMEEDLNTQEQELNNLINEKQETIEGFSRQLSEAKAKANQYEQQIKAQSAQIKQIYQQEQQKIQEENRKKEEELAKKKAEEAAKKKAEEDANKSLAKSSDSFVGDKNADGSASAATTIDGLTVDAEDGMVREGGDEISATQWLDGTTDTGAVAATESTTTSTSSVSAAGSGLGAEIANYGLQFVGNPYVSGGTSLTNGCDCSGFTQSVYAHFGINIPRSSYSQSSGGTEVPYSAIQAGDIIYYGGHVGIYIGNDQIVHASTPSTGIKVSSAHYRSIITIRRYY